jgi:hypothetical protein
MTAILLYFLLNRPLTVLTFENEGMETIAVFSTAQIDSVNAKTKDAALPIYIRYVVK